MNALPIPHLSLAKARLKIVFRFSLWLAFFSAGLPGLFAQGSLTPSGAPAPTMKTLAQIEPRTPISSLPFTISTSGSYYLTTNLTGTSGFNGITIASGNVTLDLAGFALLGVPGSLQGISTVGGADRTNVTVRNGTVSGWGGHGVQAGSTASRNLVVDRLNVSASGGYGIFAYGTLISGCTVNGSGSGGINVNNSDIRNCSVTSCASNGIDAYSSAVRDCLVDKSGLYGIYVSPGTVSGCLVQNNGQHGIYVGNPGTQIIGNTCKGNNTANSASFAGIYVATSNNRIENNHLDGNGASGSGIAVNVSFTGNIIIKNSVSGNGANNYVVPGTQVVGPLIITTGTITNSNPWANFSY